MIWLSQTRQSAMFMTIVAVWGVVVWVGDLNGLEGSKTMRTVTEVV